MIDLRRKPDWAERTYDVIVIGAGITGVNVARELSGRGATVLLLDKGDIGQGTSSATTKYIHGGIRYLETHEFRVVRESLRERRFLSLAAPHLVSQRTFLMPAWSWSKPPAALIGAGVGLYTALGFDRNRDVPAVLRTPLPRWLSKRRLVERVPWIDQRDLHGAFAYHDTLNLHPERLLLALAQSAVAGGAVLVTHAEAVGFDTVAGSNGDGSVRVTGVVVSDRLHGTTHHVAASAVINAGGPWMDLVLRSLGCDLGVGVQRSKGVHLLTRPIGGQPGADTVFARARDGRHVIVSPWEGQHFIGPTDTAVDSDPDHTPALVSDVQSILDTVNDTVGNPAQRLTFADVRHVTVGIRPLIVEHGKASFSTSRRLELYDHRRSGVGGLWSIGGGKWTTGRALGVEVAEAVVPGLGLGARRREFDSRRVGVVTGFGWGADPRPFFEAAVRSRPELPVDAERRVYLARLYGANAERVLDLVAADASLAAPVSSRRNRMDIAAQAVFAVAEEGAQTLIDVVDRRLVLGTLGGVTEVELTRVAGLIAPLLGWSAEEAAEHVAQEWAIRQTRRALWDRAPDT